MKSNASFSPSALFVLLLLAFCMFLTACQPTNDPPTDEQYPILFKYQKLDFQPSKSYVLTDTSYQVLPAGVYAAELYVEENLAIESWDFEIEKVELLDSSQLRLYFFPALAITPSDTVVPYKKVGATGIELDLPGTPFYRFQWDKTNKTLRFDLLTVQYTYHNAGGTNYSPLQIGEGVSDVDNPGALIEQQRSLWNLQPGDTLLLNHSGWLYPEQ